MQRLTTRQIAEYTSPLAFSTLRSQPFGQAPQVDRKRPVVTSSLEESYRLVRGAKERMGMVRANLTTLLELSQQGQRSGVSDRRRAELVGLMRSLTAGIDDIISQSKFKEQPLFEGKKFNLGLERGQPLRFELPDLRTSKIGDRPLTRQIERADVEILYDAGLNARNTASGLFGLEVSAGELVPPREGFPELRDGIYNGEIRYEGANSTVIIRDQSGLELIRQNNVDLSGSGREFVTFDNGLQLQVDKESLFDAIDKYDFENFGPASHHFSFGYERVKGQELYSGDGNSAVHDQVGLLSNLSLNRDGSSLQINGVRMSGVADGVEGLDSGSYLLEVRYNGSESSVRLTDLSGRVRGEVRGVDLTQNRTVTLDTGLRIEIGNTGLADGVTGRASAVVEVERARSATDKFDFRGYSASIEAALKLIDEQMELLAEAEFAIEDQNMLKNAMAQGVTMPSAALMAGGATGILTSSVTGKFNLFGGGALDSQLGAVSSQIFNHTSGALSAQTGGGMLGQGPVSMFEMLGTVQQGGGGLFG